MANRTAKMDLSHLELCAGLDQEAMRRLLGGLPAARLQAGDNLEMTSGEVACSLVFAGRLALDVDTPTESHRRIVTLVEEGDVLIPPEHTWARVGPRLRCRAIDVSDILLVDHARFEQWLAEPRMAANLVRVLASQVADRELAIAIALEPRVERRLLLKLQQLGERFGRVTQQGVRLDLRLTHQQLADMIGAVRESITIALGNLAQNGALTVENRTIWIHPERESVDPPD